MSEIDHRSAREMFSIVIDRSLFLHFTYRMAGPFGLLVVSVVCIAVNIGECCEGTQRPFRVLCSITVKYN